MAVTAGSRMLPLGRTNKDARVPPTGPYKKHMAEPTRPASPVEDSNARSSFSSVREDDSDLAQAFTISRTSSYSRALCNKVIDDDSSSGEMTEVEYLPPLTNPSSKLHGYFFPANSFKGWKEINVRGKLASKSFGDLQSLHLVWTPTKAPPKKDRKYEPGQAPIERLPMELLEQILDPLVLDVPTGVSPRNTDLRALLLTSRTLHSATLGTLYKNITIPHSKIFRKFLTTIQQHPSLGTLVRRLDFSHFNPATLFSTASERAQAKNLTSETLLQCLELTPYLQEFLAQEHIDDDLNADVLRKLFLEMPRLQALDFCGCSSPSFRNAFQSILLAPWPSPSTPLSITRLSLHKCLSLPSAVFETLLPRLGHLTHLDVAGTRITDSALLSLAPTARLTHLNLAKCMHLSARAVVDFLGSHPAACSGTLVFLSVASDARTHQLLDVDDVTQLLRRLNKTASPSLRSLSLKGSKMSAEHMDLLRPLTKHLEELALGRRITIHDINRLFASDGAIAAAANKDVDAMDVDGEDAVDDWKPHTLRYLDVSDLTMAELDLTNLFDARACKILVTSDTKVSLGHDPRDDTNTLEVFEIGPEDVFPRLQRSSAALARMGWKASEFGRRAWLVRVHAPGTKSDDGRRGWKWGATYWGMRKIPVARQDVGGMYGSFMFARNL